MNDDESAVRHAKAEGRPLRADYLRGYATALIDAIAAIEYARGGAEDAAYDGMNAALFVLRHMRPPAGSDRPDSERP